MTLTLPAITISRADAIAVVRDRIAELPEDCTQWSIRLERKALGWLIGEYRGRRPACNLRRAVRHRIQWVKSRNKAGAWAVELAALQLLYAERLEIGDYRYQFEIPREWTEASLGR